MNSLDLPNLLPNVDLSALQQMWLERKITNYEYLTHLNKMAGRSYNDLMQYPVMPFLISQYTENVLDLEDPNIFRYVHSVCEYTEDILNVKSKVFLKSSNI